MTEQDIIKGLQEENESALTAIFDKLYRQLLFFAQEIIDDEEDAKDVVMVAFEKLWKNKNRGFDDLKHIKNHLYLSVRNSCIEQMRRRKIRAKYQQQIAGHEPHVESILDRKYQQSEIVVQLYNQINRLPQRMQQAFKLTYIEGYSRAEVAGIMQVSENTVRNQLERAKELIRKGLSEKEMLVACFLIICNSVNRW